MISCPTLVLHICNAAWVKAPLKKRQVVKKETKAVKAEQTLHELSGRSKGRRDCNLEKVVAGKI